MRSSKPVARGNVGERAREIRSLLTKLASGATLTPDGEHGFRLTAPAANSSAVPEDIVAAKLVEACLAQDWLERHGERLRLSHVGRAWLRRSAAEGDAFRAQHQVRASGEREIDGTRRPVLLNEAESPLGWLKSRKDRNGSPLLTGQQYEAGERSARRLLVCADEPARDSELVGSRAVGALAPRRAVKRGRSPRRGHRRQGARHAGA